MKKNLNGAFVNILYKESWAKYVGETTNEYRNGTYASSDGITYTIYDGATNYMGKVNVKTGKILCNGETSEYKESFLQSALIALDK